MSVPIAIVGMSCQFPEVTNLEEFWFALTHSKQYIRKINKNNYYGMFSEKSNYRENPVEACRKIILQTLMHAGYTTKTKFSLIIGNLLAPTEKQYQYFSHIYRSYVSQQENLSTQSFCSDSISIDAMSKSFNLAPTSFIFDAACASAIYAFKFAKLLLISGQADIVVAGAVCLPAVEQIISVFSTLQALSSKANYLPLSNNPQGLIPGEGLGFFMLKTLKQAEKDKDIIYAIIEDIAISNDAGGQHLLAPDGKGQEYNLNKVYCSSSNLNKKIDYIECHATGTARGDITELSTLESIFKNYETKPKIGANKGHFGHTLTASGVISILKVILAFQHQLIPKTLTDGNLLYPNGSEWIKESILIENHIWNKRSSPRYAGVNAFGFGGCNSHVLLSDDAKSKHQTLSLKQMPKIAVTGLGMYLGTTTNISELTQQLYTNQPLDNKWISSINVDLLRYKIPANQSDMPVLSQLAMLKAVDEALTDAGYTISGQTKPIGVIIVSSGDYHINRQFYRNWIDSNFDEWTQSMNIAEYIDKNDVLEKLTANFATALGSEKASSFIGNLIASKIASLWRFSGPAFVISHESNAMANVINLAQLLLSNDELEAVVIGAVDMLGNIEKQLLKCKSHSKLTQTEGAVALVLKPNKQNESESYGIIDAVTFSDKLPDLDVTNIIESALENSEIKLDTNVHFSKNKIHAGAVTPFISLINSCLKINNKWLFTKENTSPGFWLRNNKQKRRGYLLTGASIENNAHMLIIEPENKKTTTVNIQQAFLIPLCGINEVEFIYTLSELEKNTTNLPLWQISNLYIKKFDERSKASLCLVFVVKSIDQLRQEIKLATNGIQTAFSTGKDWQLPSGTCFTAKPLGSYKKLAFVYPMSGIFYPNVFGNLLSLFPQCTDFIDVLSEYTLGKVNFNLIFSNEVLDKETYDPFTLIGSIVNYGKLVSNILIQQFGIVPDASCGCSLGELTMLCSLAKARDENTDEKLFLLLEKLIPIVFQPKEQEYKTIFVKGKIDKLTKAFSKTNKLYLQIIASQTESIVSGIMTELEQWLISNSYQYSSAANIGYVHTPLAKISNSLFEDLDTLFFGCNTLNQFTFYSASQPNLMNTYENLNVSKMIADIIKKPVDFPDIINKMYADNIGFFIDIGPGTSSKRWIEEILQNSEYVVESIYDTTDITHKGILKLVARLLTHQFKTNLASYILDRNQINKLIGIEVVNLNPFLDNLNGFKSRLKQNQLRKVENIRNFQKVIEYHKALTKLMNGTIPESRKEIIWNYQQILEMTQGSITKVLGTKYNSIDKSLKRARMPAPPFLFVNRILSLNANYQRLGFSSIEWEFDLPRDGIYLVNNEIWPLLFFESSHCSILLVSYLGIEQMLEGEFSYRILKSESSVIADFPAPGQTFSGKIEIQDFVKLSEQLLIKFNYTIYNNGIPFIKSTNLGGLFTQKSLTQEIKSEFLNNMQNDIDLKLNSLTTLYSQYKLCNENLLMLHNITKCSVNEGPFGLGLIHSDWNISSDFWVFKYHFINDPVLPGTLMIEGLLQNIKVFAIYTGAAQKYKSPDFFFVHNKPTKTEFLGQVKPHQKKLYYELVIKDISTVKNSTIFTADGIIHCDGSVVLKQKNLSIGLRELFNKAEIEQEACTDV